MLYDMLRSAHNVVSRYLGQNAEDDGLPWMEHLDKSQEPVPGLSSMVNALAPAVRKEGRPAGDTTDNHRQEDVGKSLQDDIPDAKSMAREQGGPAVRSDVEDLESGTVPITHFNTPSMYGPGSSLQQWWDSRERDDQNTGTAFGQQYTGLPVEASCTEVQMLRAAGGALAEEVPSVSFSMDRQAKTLQQVINDNTHSKRAITVARARNLHPILMSTEDELRKGIMHFKMRSSGSPKERHVVFQFLRRSDGKPTSNPVRENDCLLGCTCPAFLFWGPQYYAVEGQYMFKDMQRETIVSPEGESRGAIVAPGTYVPKAEAKGQKLHRGTGGTFCKHIYAAFLAAQSLSHKVEGQSLLEKPEELDSEESSLLPEHLDTEIEEGASTFGQFKQYLMSGVVEPELWDFVSNLLSEHGSSIADMDKYIASPWNAWMGSQSGQEVANMLKTMDQWKTAPSVVVYVLKNSAPVLRRSGKQIPPAVLRKAYRIIKNWL